MITMLWDKGINKFVEMLHMHFINVFQGINDYEMLTCGADMCGDRNVYNTK